MLERILPPTFELHNFPSGDPAVARLVVLYCVQCHNLPNRAMHDAAKWPAIFERMVVRMRARATWASDAGHDGGREAPSVDEASVLLAYLQKARSRAARPEEISAVDRPEGQSFKLACQQCHVLPDPQRHTACEWPAVVARMGKTGMDEPRRRQPARARRAAAENRGDHAFLIKYARKGLNQEGTAIPRLTAGLHRSRRTSASRWDRRSSRSLATRSARPG